MIEAVIGDIESAMPVVSGTRQTTTYAYGVCVAERDEQAEAERDREHAERHRAVRAEPRAQVRREGRDDHHDRRDRHQAECRRQRAVPEYELEVLGDEEHHAVHRDEHEDHAAGTGAERRSLEVVHVEHRLGRVQLPRDEDREHGDRDDERHERADAQPAVVGGLDQPVDEGDDADDRQDRADRVELRLLGVARLRHEELACDRARAR